MKPEDRKRLKQHIEMIVEHKEPTQTEKILRDAIEEQIKGKLELEDKNRKLRAELNALRVKTSQQERFIWWIWNVYSRNVIDLIYDIMGATTYDTEGEAKDGKYALPKHCFDLMKRIDEYTEHIYDGTYLDVEISTDAKKGIPENKPAYNENANSLLRSAWMIANRNGEQTNWEAFKNAVYKELVVEHNAKTSTDNNKRESNE